MELADVPYYGLLWLPIVGLGAAVLVVFRPQRRWTGVLTAAYALLALLVALRYTVSWWWPGDAWLNSLRLAAVAAAAAALGLSIAVLASSERPRSFVLGGLTATACLASAATLLLVRFAGSGL
jgi:hypothetical protein